MQMFLTCCLVAGESNDYTATWRFTACSRVTICSNDAPSTKKAEQVTTTFLCVAILLVLQAKPT